MTCKDCIHYEACHDMYYEEHATRHFDPEKHNAEKECGYFKDRSRFVVLSHAEWVEDEDMYGDPIYHCSNCNEHFVLEEGTPTDNCYFYCPNCGAKMDEQSLKEREAT